MATAVEEPQVEVREEWRPLERGNYLVIYRYYLGTFRLYLFKDASRYLVEQLMSIHMKFVPCGDVAVNLRIVQFPDEYREFMIFDSLDGGPPPQILADEPRVIVTGQK